MKKYSLMMILVGLILYSCNSKNEEFESLPADNQSQLRNTVTFSGLTSGVSVLIFKEDSPDNFYYQESIVSGWDADNKVKKGLNSGNYKFLYVKCPAVNTVPYTLTQNTKFENVRFVAKQDQNRSSEYITPVDEIWLAETPQIAATKYSIQGGDKIKNRMTRAVSQIELRLKRGMWENNAFVDSIIYPAGKNIMENIRQIEMEVNGVGNTLDYAGGKGNKKMIETFSVADADISGVTGFASFDGPFVFPTADVNETTIDLKIVPAAGSPFPEMSKQLSGKLERNKKLIVTVWLSSTYQHIDIEYQTEFFEEPENGDEGIWD